MNDFDAPTHGENTPAATTADTLLPDLVTAWGHGWARSRGVPRPVAVPGGFRADVGLHGHRVRYVLHTWDSELLSALDRQVAAPGTWIKISGRSAALRGALSADWTMDDTGHLMSTPFTVGAADVQAPYAMRVTTAGEVVVATVVDATGATAAAGHLAPEGEFGIVDRVETAPAHRRRGLGTVVMRALSDHAARNGMTTGLLVATDEGRRLYHSLGWRVRSEIAAAYVPED
ncbi:GNAT family N-acetyltransferase [Catellatospora methionotrophica]|uniref:GNAT family N-acetyltransferase n=1 Tax=Catellatospora methionotrophica TaxID=121620 RepID=UPI0033D7A6BE